MAANKYLDLAGLQEYTKQLYIKFPSSVEYVGEAGSKKFTYTTYTYPEGVKTAHANDIVTLATLKTDLGIGTEGVTAVAESTTNGSISVTQNGTTADVAVHGLGTAAYTASTDYATAAQGAKADTAVQSFSGITASVSEGVATVTAIPATTITAGALADGMTATTQQSYDSSNADLLATTGYVESRISGIANAMVFKGSVGTGGTITTLPTASADNLGYTYKVITDGAGGTGSKVGDVVVCAQTSTNPDPVVYSWVIIPSGDEPSGTVTSVGAVVAGKTDAITISDTPVTSSGNITFTVNAATNPQGKDPTFGVVAVGSNITNTNGVISVSAAANGTLGVASANPANGITSTNGDLAITSIPETVMINITTAEVDNLFA